MDDTPWPSIDDLSVGFYVTDAAEDAGVDVDAVTVRYLRLDEWVEGFLAPTIRRTMSGSNHWCAQWWEHPEAVARLGALWAAWEVAEAEGGAGPSFWWTGHFEPHWHVLTSTFGPFNACNPNKHEPAVPPLPTVPAPLTAAPDEG